MSAGGALIQVTDTTYTGLASGGNVAAFFAGNGIMTRVTGVLVSDTHTLFASAPDLGGELLIEDCQLSGTYRGIFSAQGGDAPVTVRDCTDTGGPKSVYITQGADPETPVAVLENNVFAGEVVFGTGIADHCISGFGNTFIFNAFYNEGVQDLVNKAGLDPAPVASAATINLSANYNEVNVTGTTPIDTIYMGGSLSSQNDVFAGDYLLTFVDAAVVIGAGGIGNITTLSSGPRTPGSSAWFVYNQATSKWVETPVVIPPDPAPIIYSPVPRRYRRLPHHGLGCVGRRRDQGRRLRPLRPVARLHLGHQQRRRHR